MTNGPIYRFSELVDLIAEADSFVLRLVIDQIIDDQAYYPKEQSRLLLTAISARRQILQKL